MPWLPLGQTAIKKPHETVHAAARTAEAVNYFDAAGAAGAAVEAGADACSDAPWFDSPCMSTLSPTFMMTKSATSANAMKPAKTFHMADLQMS
jgi:hypothetical protein